jgi:preprotein translocase subunit SecE
VADKEEVEPPSEASPAQSPDASETSAEVRPLRTGVNGAKATKDEASSNSQSEEALEPAGVAAAASGAKAKTARAARPAHAPKAAPTNKRNRPAKPERTTPVKFVRQSIGELRKVVYPTGQQLINYFVVVLVFVLFVIAYVSLLDLGLGWVIFKIFS